MGLKIHKAARPKRDYINPAICMTTEPNIGIESRTSWKKVNCKKCLKLKRRQSE